MYFDRHMCIYSQYTTNRFSKWFKTDKDQQVACAMSTSIIDILHVQGKENNNK